MNKETSLITATLSDLVLALREAAQEERSATETKVKGGDTSDAYAVGIQGLADLLHCSLSTANRRRKEGVFNEATYKSKNILLFDKAKVMEIIKVRSNFVNNRGGYKHFK